MSLVVTIMAAGKGTRMKSDIPKVLHSFCGEPMITYIIKAVRKLSPREIIVIVSNENATDIKNCILEYCGLLGIRFVTQNTLQGTGEAIKCSLFCYSPSDKVLILNGDMPAITADILQKFIICDYKTIVKRNKCYNHYHIESFELEYYDCKANDTIITNSGIYIFGMCKYICIY